MCLKGVAFVKHEVVLNTLLINAQLALRIISYITEHLDSR